MWPRNARRFPEIRTGTQQHLPAAAAAVRTSRFAPPTAHGLWREEALLEHPRLGRRVVQRVPKEADQGAVPLAPFGGALLVHRHLHVGEDLVTVPAWTSTSLAFRLRARVTIAPDRTARGLPWSSPRPWSGDVASSFSLPSSCSFWCGLCKCTCKILLHSSPGYV